ncbi:MAG TPA: exodeoxyribonuclease VII small subunit, partial [Roseiarcus sp.]
LKKRCDELLKNAEMRIEKITLGADGAFKGVTPLDED